jgi:hypothetical protein
MGGGAICRSRSRIKLRQIVARFFPYSPYGTNRLSIIEIASIGSEMLN